MREQDACSRLLIDIKLRRALTVVETAPATNSTIRPSVAPSRQGRVHIGAYLPADFKRGIRMLQATTGEDLQSILARVLNEQFRLHNLPVVGQD